MSLQEVYKRVSTEHEELWANIERLQAFRDGKQPSSVSDYQWKMLKKQLKAMRKYNEILALRCEDMHNELFCWADEFKKLDEAEKNAQHPEPDPIHNISGLDIIQSSINNKPKATIDNILNGFDEIFSEVLKRSNTPENKPLTPEQAVSFIQNLITDKIKKPGHVQTPGQAVVIDLRNAKMQKAEDFMKDEPDSDVDSDLKHKLK